MTPWTRADLRTAVSTTVVGVIILVWAWWEASGAVDLDEQTGWLVVGVLGVIVVLKGQFSWLRTSWRLVRQRRLEVVQAWDDAGLVRPVAATTDTPRAANGSVTVRGSTRYHRPECLLVRGKPLTTTPDPRSRPCEMCAPVDVQSEVMVL